MQNESSQVLLAFICVSHNPKHTCFHSLEPFLKMHNEQLKAMCYFENKKFLKIEQFSTQHQLYQFLYSL
jgi:hypothetical protein